MAVSCEYVCVGCNETPHSVDWNSDGLLAYAAGNSVAVATKGKVKFPGAGLGLVNVAQVQCKFSE